MVEGDNERLALRFVRLGAEPIGDWDAAEHRFRARVHVPRSALATRAAAGTRILLHIGGIATISELRMNGVLIHRSQSMFAAATLDVSDHAVAGSNEIDVRVLPLTDHLAALPRRPRARWRTRLVNDGALRWVRTSLLGRCPGFAPGPPIVGPWRPMLLEIRRSVSVESFYAVTSICGDVGVIRFEGRLSSSAHDAPSVEIVADGPTGISRVTASFLEGRFCGELRIPRAERWWPHTHGRPTRYELRVCLDGEPLVLPGDGTAGTDSTVRRIGFRTVALDAGPDGHGFGLVVNGVPIFCRGAVWSGSDSDDVGVARDLGMNMLRIPGIAWYESDAFLDRCDELGLLVWQELMFANFDYPLGDGRFAAECRAEIETQVDRLVGRPSWVVLCGSSEIEQQAAMLGLPTATSPARATEASAAEPPTIEAMAKAALQSRHADALWVSSSPTGGDLPFRTDRGISHYFGVGAYRRPMSDARSAGVRFAAECLAFANLEPAAPASASTLGTARNTADAWRGAPRDNGADWDFADVTEHYLSERYGELLTAGSSTEGSARRREDLAREVTGVVMAEVFGEWRRAGSSCAGGLVLWLRDRVPGAGWGVIAADGRLKAAAHHLRRILAPTAVWFTDEGLNGLDVHIAHDPSEPLTAELDVRLYADHEVPVGAVRVPVRLNGHDSLTLGVEQLLGRFVDASYAYRFGPPAQDLIVATLRPRGELADPGGDVAAFDPTPMNAFFFPDGPPRWHRTASELGVRAELQRLADGRLALRITTRGFLWAVHVEADGFDCSDDAFSIEPGGEHTVVLRPAATDATPNGVVVTALNMADAVGVSVGSDQSTSQ